MNPSAWCAPTARTLPTGNFRSRGESGMNFNTWIPAPRGNSVRAQGPVSGLANGACRLPMRIPASRRPASRPQWHRGTPLQSLTVAGAAQELGDHSVPPAFDFGSPSYRGKPAKDCGGSFSVSGHPHLFPVELWPRNSAGAPENMGRILPEDCGRGPVRQALRRGFKHASRGRGRARANMSKHIQKKPLPVDLTRFLSL